jgi:hypothetical protein
MKTAENSIAESKSNLSIDHCNILMYLKHKIPPIMLKSKVVYSVYVAHIFAELCNSAIYP